MTDQFIEKMLDEKERIVWEGKPDRITYIIGHPVFYIFAIFWALIDASILSSMFNQGNPPLYMIIVFTAHLTPVWIALGGPVYRAINWKFVQYVMTDKRIYFLSGIIGRDVKVVDFAAVSEPSVNVGLIEKLRDCGSIHLKPYTEYSQQKGRTPNMGVLRHIASPYDVYKQIKQMALDIRTDVSYPNEMRPEVNPSFNTQYSSQETNTDNDSPMF